MLLRYIPKMKNNSLLKKFVISYVMVLTLIFSVTGSFYFVKSIGLIRDETMMTGKNMVEEGKNTIDSKLEALMGLSVPLVSRDNALDISYIERPFPPDSSITFSVLKQRLSAYAMMSDFADTITLYYPNNKLFISNRSAGIYYNAYFGAWMEHYGMSFDRWDEIVRADNNRKIVSGYRRDGVMMIDVVSRMPTSSKSPVYLIITVDGRKLGSFFEPLTQYDGSLFCVLGPDGVIYYSSADTATTMSLLSSENSGDEYMSFRTGSEVAGFEYAAFIPLRSLYQREYNLVRDFIVIYLILVFVSIALFVLLSYYNILPLKRVVENIARRQSVYIGICKGAV